MIFTNHRNKLKVPPGVYQEREARLAKFIELKAPPVIVKHAAQLLVAGFSWSWRGLAEDLWVWARYSPAGWWARWLLSCKFRRETDAAGLEMMSALSGSLKDAGAAAKNLATAMQEASTTVEDLTPAIEGAEPVIQPNRRRRLLEPWSTWRRRVEGGARS